jgi:hypothetical protein
MKTTSQILGFNFKKAYASRCPKILISIEN